MGSKFFRFLLFASPLIILLTALILAFMEQF
jgi:hypothetical protein